jgi:hypothetical protein
MANEIQICNLALSHIGAAAISSFEEESKEAIECKRLYEYERDSVLRDHQWNFALKEIDLALLTDEYSGWDYAYAYPNDCLRVNRIFNVYGAPNSTYPNAQEIDYNYAGRIPYEVRANTSLSSKVILTNEENATLLYTARITTPNLFDSVFIEALSWKLATDLAQPVRGDLQLQQFCFQQYLFILSKALAKDSNEGYEHPSDANAFVNARL